MAGIVPVPMIGATIAVSDAEPATEDQAGFEALSWTEVGGTQSFPSLAENASNQTATLLKDGVTKNYNGPTTIDPYDLSYIYDFSDAGQTIIRANYNGADTISIRASYPDNKVKYHTAVLGNLRTMEATPEGYHGEMINVRPQSLMTTVAS